MSQCIVIINKKNYQMNDIKDKKIYKIGKQIKEIKIVQKVIRLNLQVKIYLKMLRQGLIEFDMREIQSIQRQESKTYQKRRKQLYQNEQTTKNYQQIDKEEYSMAKEEIFPSKFTPFFIDNFTKKSSLQIHQYSISQNDVEKINQRVRKFYQILNQFHQYQKQQLSCIFQLDLFENFIQQVSLIKKNYGQSSYYSYFEEGKSLCEVQSWRLKHRQNDPHLLYSLRQSLFHQSILLLKFLASLTLISKFENIGIKLNDIFVVQNQSSNFNDKDFQLRIKLKWTLNIILDKQADSTAQKILAFAKNLTIKLLSIEGPKQKLTKLQQFHKKKIQELKYIDEISRLKYQDFYSNTQKVQKTQQKNDINQIDKQQSLQKLKQQIIKLQEKAKEQIKTIKIVTQSPKVSFGSSESKKYFWAQINKIIVKNLSENERKNIILASKKSTQTNKKLQTSKDNKSIIKQTKDKQINKNFSQNKTQQVTIQAKYLGSGSDLKFRPDKLISLIDEKTILYVLKVFNKSSNTTNHVGCFLNTKVLKQSIGLFGSYFQDSTKKSFIYNEKNDLFSPLTDKSHAIGYGPQIFLSIGKLDLIIPCFGTEIIDKKQMLKCASYFPISYSARMKQVQQFEQLEEDQNLSRQQETKTNTSFNLIGIQKQFFLEDIDIYEIKFKVQ